MICMFTHEPCKYIKWPLWSERKQACHFVLVVDKILDEEPPKAPMDKSRIGGGDAYEELAIRKD